MQRIKMCQNPDMIVDLARLILVSMFWASGRGADASGMSVKEYHSNIATPFPPNPIRHPSWYKLKRLDVSVWVPVMAVLGPRCAISRQGRKFIIPTEDPPGRLPKKTAVAALIEGPESWVGDAQIARSKHYTTDKEGEWKLLENPALAKTVSTLLTVVSGVLEEVLSSLHLTGASHTGRHTLGKLAARFARGRTRPPTRTP
eukprot:scaffold21834_cov123-Isochrysis_galbana.AAC.10